MTTTIDALVDALEKISTGDAWHEDGVIGFAKEALALARAEQAEPSHIHEAGEMASTIYIAFASSYVSIRYWTQDAEAAKRFSEREGVPITAFYAAPAVEQAEPLFWYRPVCNGEMYEGPIHNNSVGGKMLRDEKPGEWKPLYATPPAAPANPTAWRYTANGHVILMDGPNPPPDDAYDEGSLIGLAPTCKDGLQVPTDKESLTVAPSAKLKPLTDDEVDALWESSEKFQNPYLAYIHGVVDAEAAHNAKLGGA